MPNKQTIFRRIFILYAIVILLAVVITEMHIIRTVRWQMIDRIAENLAVQAALISRHVPSFSVPYLDQAAKELKDITGARIMLIDRHGKVIGDSDPDHFTEENYLKMIEIQQAAVSGRGITIRRSVTHNDDLLYVALRLSREKGDTGYIRLSVPLTEVDASVNSLRYRIYIAIGLLLLSTGIFLLARMERIRRLTIEIRDFANSISAGNLDKRLLTGDAGEFHEIAWSLNFMASEFQKNIAKNEEEKRRLSAILRTIPDALLISDADGTVQLWSDAAVKFFGTVSSRGSRLSEIVRIREFLTLMDEVKKRGEPATTEFQLDYPEERHVIALVAPLSFRNAEFSGFVAIFHDITQLKILERMRRDFVANVSHEIKTPIAAIQGFAETLLDGALENKQDARKFIEIIRNHSARLGRLVDDLFTLSRIERGEIAFQIRPVNIEKIIENSISLIKKRSEEKKINITINTEPGLPDINADPDRITQVMVNLLDNAVKFTPEGGSVMIQARLSSRYEGGETEGDKLSHHKSCLEVSVEDTGPGIPPMHIPRLGERFYRVDSARSRELGGTGLGLAIVKHILQAHGSGLLIRNAPTGGAVFSFQLPVSLHKQC